MAEERLQKLISAAGLASRRTAEEWIAEGRVTVNGKTATLGQRADPEKDEVLAGGVRVLPQRDTVVLMLNKPRGYVTTMEDEQGRSTAASLVEDCGRRVYPVGRLDMDSEGLLLFTDDGALANALMHPRTGIWKTYLIRVKGADGDFARRMAAPMALDGVPLAPARVRLLSDTGTCQRLSVSIREGRNRQVRRMAEQAGGRVVRLRRVAEGCIRLGRLEPGKWRFLTEEERKALEEEAFS